MAHIGFLKTCGQYHIKKYAGYEESKICTRQSRKSKHLSKGRKGYYRKHYDSCTGEQCQRRRRMALYKRYLWSTYHMYNKGLAPHGFHKPARLEHGRIGILHLYELRSAEMGRQVIVKHSP